MKNKLPVLPSAILGIILLVLTAVAINIAANRSHLGAQRIDLTEHRIFTLSEGTRNILGDLDTPVTIRFYFTEGSRALPRGIKLYATRVRDFLRQYDLVGGDMVEVEFIDVQPDTEAEDRARLDGIRGTDISVTERIYFGIAVSSLDRLATIPALDPNGETLLEYNISRAITSVINPRQPRLGILTPLQVVGDGMPPQFGGTQGWIIAQQLEMDFELVSIDFEEAEIPDDLDALLVIHPTDIPPATEFAIDQYLLNGGRAAIFLDSYHFFDRQQQPNPMMPMPPSPTSSTLPNLLRAWGLEFESGLVVADQTHRFTQRGRVLTGVSSFTGDSLSNDDPVIAQLSDVFMILPGGFTGEPATGLFKENLVTTTQNTMLFEGDRAREWDQGLLTDGIPSGQTFGMVVRLNGRFPTAFPDGRPGAPQLAADTDGEEDSEENGANQSEFLKEAVAEGAVVLFADVDMIADEGAFERNPIIPQIVEPYNGNFSLAMNVIEQLSGDSNLIGARSRPSSRRPFKVIEEMQAAAERAASDKIAELVSTEEELSRRIAELQGGQTDDEGRLLLSQEQQNAIQEAFERQVEVRSELRELRRDLARDRDRLEARLIMANMFIVPGGVAFFGIAFALYRRARTRAR